MITYKSLLMRHGRITINLILLIVIGILSFLAFWKYEKYTGPLLSGIVKLSTNDSRKQYKESLSNYFDPEPTWKPSKKNNTSTQPEIVGKVGVLIDINSGDILYEKNANKKMPIASLVKIMTAVVALEHKDPNDLMYVTRHAGGIGENSMGITPGEVYTLEELLYGLILHSGNDSAYAIAEGVAGDDERFVEWMNYKAKEIGLGNTHFADPSGLDDETYSTPTDLVKLTRYALKNPTFREIVKTVEHEIYSDEDNKYLYLYNQTNLLTTYPGVQGVKTGFTEEAGLCLTTYANNEGKEVVGVVLNSTDGRVT